MTLRSETKGPRVHDESKAEGTTQLLTTWQRRCRRKLIGFSTFLNLQAVSVQRSFGVSLGRAERHVAWARLIALGSLHKGPG